jgi:hypothetical protein
MNSQQLQENYLYVQTKYWRLDVYSEKTVVYDKAVFEDDYVPKLCEIWEVICKCNSMIAKGEDVSSYVDDLENQNDSPFYNEKKRKKKTLSPTNSTSALGSSKSKPTNDIELDF